MKFENRMSDTMGQETRPGDAVNIIRASDPPLVCTKERAIVDIIAPPEQNLSPEPTIRIPLGYGRFAIIDSADAWLAVQYRWGCVHTRNKPYAVSWSKEDGKTVNTLLHVLLMQPPEGLRVDHINGDGLDCRRANMRFATNSQNQQNKMKSSHSKSPYKGVDYLRSSGLWRARIGIDRKQVTIGTYDTAEDAALAYDAKARELFGEFARPNFRDDEVAA